MNVQKSLSLLTLMFTITLQGNPYNDKSFILYRPQTQVITNTGQPKSGPCPNTRSAPNFAFPQYEGLWFKRYRSRITETEASWRCSYIRYIDEGNGKIFIIDHNQNNVTNNWFRQNATSVLFPNDSASWKSTLPNGQVFDTHILYFQPNPGISLLYSCGTTKSGHSGIGNIYTRTPNVPLSEQFLQQMNDIYYQNGIYDILPLHLIDQQSCDRENI